MRVFRCHALNGVNATGRQLTAGQLEPEAGRTVIYAAMFEGGMGYRNDSSEDYHRISAPASLTSKRTLSPPPVHSSAPCSSLARAPLWSPSTLSQRRVSQPAMSRKASTWSSTADTTTTAAALT